MQTCIAMKSGGRFFGGTPISMRRVPSSSDNLKSMASSRDSDPEFPPIENSAKKSARFSKQYRRFTAGSSPTVTQGNWFPEHFKSDWDEVSKYDKSKFDDGSESWFPNDSKEKSMLFEELSIEEEPEFTVGRIFDHSDDAATSLESMPKTQIEYVKGLIRSSFWDINLNIPQLEKDKYRNIGIIGELNVDLAVIRELAGQIGAEFMNADNQAWQRFLAFKSLLTQYVLYHDIFNNAILHHANIGVDIFSLHLTIPFLNMISDVTLMKKIVQDLSWLRRKFKSRDEIQIVSQFTTKQPISDIENMKWDNLLPKGLRKANIYLKRSDTESASALATTTEDIISNQRDLISPDVSLSVINGVQGAIKLMEGPFPKLKGFSRNHLTNLVLTGATLVIDCTKIALNPNSLLKEQTIIITITVKAVELIEIIKELRDD